MATKNSQNLQSDTSFEKDLMEAANVESLNITEPRDVDKESAKPRIQQQTAPVAQKEPEHEGRIERKAHAKLETVASDMLLPFMRNPLVNIIEPKASTFIPSTIMMFYIIHQMDSLMVQNYYFNRSTNFYHPYISRLYFSVLYIIQTLRCMNYAGILDRKRKLFLTQFLEDFPPESLSIPGPLIPYFKALCVSQPNDLNLGRVIPSLPKELGTRMTKDRIRPAPYAWLIPNIPLLIGFINRITSVEAKASVRRSPNSNTAKEYPAPWNPLLVLAATSDDPPRDIQPTINGETWSSDPATWDIINTWALTSPGIDFPTETTDEQDKKFTRYGSQIGVPHLGRNSDTRDVQNYTQLDEPEWFSELMTLMTIYSKYFKAPGTLADCSPYGPSSNRITIKYKTPKKVPTPPTYPGDKDSRYPLEFTSSTTEYGINQQHQMMSHLAQQNAELFNEHPIAANAGSFNLGDKTGPFWEILPISHSSMNDTGYLQIKDVISDHFALDKAMN